MDNLAREEFYYIESSYQRITLNSSPKYAFFKRVLDVVGAIFGMFILSPLYLIVTFLIKVEDPSGCVLFSQERVGLRGKKFRMYKFRSMQVDAEEKLEGLLAFNEVEGAMFKMKDDPRITRIGKFIRKTSIDELPQLWNVLMGEMSLVGPRPPLPREVASYNSYEKQRLFVKPGCTGLWQISGRNELNFKEMVDLDLDYIQNRGFFLDIRIILKTFFVLFNSKGAF